MSCLTHCFKRRNLEGPNSSRFSKASLEEISPTRRRSKFSKDRDRNVTPTNAPIKQINKRLYELKDKFRCLFCGGKTCKHEDWRRNKNTAIIGLNCDQITSDLYASQRPSTILVQKFNLIRRFKELNIGLIVNVQRQGEHPYCGPNPGLEEISGFTYKPEDFTTEGIRVRLSGWKDMNVPDSIPFMLEIVKDMCKAVLKDKKTVLVHCHAGYGRTGIVLACYMIFTSTKSAEAVVQEIRKVRSACVQKSSQMEYCKTFKDYIDSARDIFTSSKKDIDTFIKHQVDLSWDDELGKISHVPKILFEVFEHILNLTSIKQYENISSNALNSNNIAVSNPSKANDYLVFKLYIYKCINGTSEWKDEYEKQIVDLKISLNRGHWYLLKEINDINILIELCFDWLEDCVICVISSDNIDKLYTDDKQLSHSIKDHIENPKNYNSEQRKKINDFLKSELRMIEYETLTCLAQFASNLSPSEDQIQKDEFHHMLEKIAIYLLGYNIDMVYENPNKDFSQKILKIVEKLIDIILFMIILIEFEYNDDHNLFLYNQRLSVNSSQIDNLLLMRLNELEKGNSTNIKVNDLTTFFNNHVSVNIERRNSYFVGYNNNNLMNKKLSMLSGNSLIMSNYFKEESARSNEKELKQIKDKSEQVNKYENPNYNSKLIHQKFSVVEKDSMLFNMYKSLQKYFDKKPLEKKINPADHMYFSHNVNNNFTSDDTFSLFNKLKNSNEINLGSSPNKDGQNGADNQEMLNDFYDCLNKFIGQNGSTMNYSYFNSPDPKGESNLVANGKYELIDNFDVGAYEKSLSNNKKEIIQGSSNDTIREEKSKDFEILYPNQIKEINENEINLKNKFHSNKDNFNELQNLQDSISNNDNIKRNYNTVKHNNQVLKLLDEEVNQGSNLIRQNSNSIIVTQNKNSSTIVNGSEHPKYVDQIDIEPTKINLINSKSYLDSDYKSYRAFDEKDANIYSYIRPKSRKRSSVKKSNSESVIVQQTNNDNNSLLSLQAKAPSLKG